MTQFLQTLFNSAVASSIYLLIALGITLVFGLTRLVNFAHGQFLVLAGFVAYEITGNGHPFVVAVVASVLVVGAVAYLSERLLFRRTLSNPLSGLIVGLGVLAILNAVIVKRWGTDPISIASPVTGFYHVGDLTIGRMRLVVLAVAACAAVLALLLLTRSRSGIHMRAANDNPLAASHVGVNVPRTISTAFVGGSIAAALAGSLLATLFPIGPNDGVGFVIKGFAVALLGGLGNVWGAVLASLIYGIGETMTATYYKPEWVPAFTFGLIIVILAVRPGGLFTRGKHTTAEADVTYIGRVESGKRWSWLNRLGGAALAIGAVALAFERQHTSRLQALFVLALVYLVVSYSLGFLYHHVGIASVAHGALMAVGAYTGAVFATEHGWGFWECLPLVLVAGALVGVVVAYPATRAHGHYLLLITFAFGEFVLVLAQNWKSVLKGDTGLVVVQRVGSIGPFEFKSLRALFYLFGVIAIVIAAVVALIARSSLGDRMHSVRDNEALAESLGLNVRLYKVVAFAVSGAMASLGGLMFLYYQNSINPISFSIGLSISFLIVVVLGGRSLVGPIVGVAIVLLAPETLKMEPVNRDLAYGIILTGVILLMPEGVVPTVKRGLSYAAARLRAARTKHHGQTTSDEIVRTSAS